MSEQQHGGPDFRPSHLPCGPEDIGRYVLMPGDPGRVPLIAAHFDRPERIGQNREYCVWTGYLDGVKVSAVSHGIGAASTAIAVEELGMLGADTFIRVGTSGGVAPGPEPGDMVVAWGAVRDEGTSDQYIFTEFPAVADRHVTNALAEGCAQLGLRYHVGVVQAKDSFYGELEPGRMPIAPELTDRWNAWIGGNVLASEMETAAMYVISSINRWRAGGIVSIYGGPSRVERLALAAVAGLRVLIARDKESI